MATKTAHQHGTADGHTQETLQVKIGGMSCSFCVATLETAIGRLPGVDEVHVSISHEEGLIRYHPDGTTADRIRQTIRDLGYTVRDPKKVRSFEEEERELREARTRFYLGAFFTGLSLFMMSLIWLGGKPPRLPIPMLLIALTTIFIVGWHILVMAWASARRAILNQHVLLEVAALGGLAGGILGIFNPRFPAMDFLAVATFVTTYHLLSGFVSLLVRTRSSQAVRKLMELQPETARVLRDGREEEIPIEQVRQDDLVRIRPGERIPIDGVVVGGRSSVDQALVTGEPIPEEKTEGDEVIGGSINQTGALTVRVTRVGAESFLAQVIRSVEEARALKPGILQLVDQVLKIFVPGVLVIGILAFGGWLIGSWAVTGHPDWTRAVFAVLAVFVMGYPCALGMATPLAMIRGGGMAAEKGILMRSGEAFQVFGKVRRVLLDKTGTVTEGRPAVAALVPTESVAPDELLQLAAAAELSSEHPLARAIVANAEERNLEIPDVQDFQSHTGQGVEATLAGDRILVGKPGFLQNQGVSLGPLADRLGELQARGQTVVAVSRKDRLIGLVAIADRVKPDAAEAVERFKALGVAPILVTGDNERTARVVAGQVDIEEVYASVLPDQKADKVRELQRQGLRVAMVGDGINDAPALMQADVGIAIGAGTDIAIESADVILVGNRLAAAVDAMEIARASFRKTKQNIILAFTFNGIGVPAAATGLVHPVWAMIAMVSSVTAVLANSFGGRLLRRVVPRREEQAEASPQHAEFRVEGIHCQGCVENIERTLAGLPGVREARADSDKGILHVEFGPDRVALDELKQAVRELGFHVAEDPAGTEHVARTEVAARVS